MAGSGSKKPLPQRIFTIAIAVIAPVVLLSFSIVPIIQALNQAPNSMSHQSEVANEQLRKEVEGYEAVLEREPDNLLALSGLAERYLQLGQFQQAIAPLTRLQELQPEDQSIAMMLGSLLLQTGEGEQAVDLFQSLYEQQPEDPTLLTGLVRAQLLAGQTEAAANLLQEKLEEQPEDRDLQLQLAQVFRRTGRSDAALEIYDRLIAEDEEDFIPVLEKAVALAQGDVEGVEPREIESLFDQAITLAPSEQRPQVEQLKTLYAQLDAANTTNAAPQTDEGIESESEVIDSSEDPAADEPTSDLPEE